MTTGNRRPVKLRLTVILFQAALGLVPPTRRYTRKHKCPIYGAIFSTALRPEHLRMPLYCQDSITAMLCWLACLKNLLFVFRECKMRQRG